MTEASKSFASANPAKTERLRTILTNDVNLTKKPGKTFSMTNLGCYVMRVMVDFVAPMFDNYRETVTDVEMSRDLKQGKIINSSPRLQNSLEPLKTTGDGNCLMHATSLYLWGIDDSSLFLRRLVHAALLEDDGDGNCLMHATSLYLWGIDDSSLFLRRLVHAALLEDDGSLRRRWEREHQALNEVLALESMGFNAEWELILSQSDPTCKNQLLPYASLQGIHIFVLSNVLRRPIIVVCEPFIRGAAGLTLQQNVLGGIYLPLLWTPAEVSTTAPIVLAFHGNHFAPLVAFESTTQTPSQKTTYNAVPLFSNDLKTLPLRFASSEEITNTDIYLRRYLSVHDITFKHDRDPTRTKTVLSADLNGDVLPEDLNLIGDHIAEFRQEYSMLAANRHAKLASEEMVTLYQKTCKICDRSFIPDKQNPLTEHDFCKSCWDDYIGSIGEKYPIAESIAMEETPLKADVKCINDDCSNNGVLRQGGFCVECYVKNNHLLAGKPEYWYDDSEFTHQTKYSKFDDHKPSTSHDVEVTEKECQTEGCLVIVENDEGALCRKCLFDNLHQRELKEKLKVKGHMTRELEEKLKVQGYMTRIPVGDDDVVMIEIPAPKKGGVTKKSGKPTDAVVKSPRRGLVSRHLGKTEPEMFRCVSPLCHNNVATASQLCEECCQVLQDNRRKTDSEGPPKCTTKDCTFYGSPEQGGLCSQCFKDKTLHEASVAAEAKAIKEQKKQLAAAKAAKALKDQQTPAARHPSPSRGKPCLTKECTRFGDPNMDGFCTRCYNVRSKTAARDEPITPATDQQQNTANRAGVNRGATDIAPTFARPDIDISRITRKQINYPPHRTNPNFTAYRNPTHTPHTSMPNAYIPPHTSPRNGWNLMENSTVPSRSVGSEEDYICIGCHNYFKIPLRNSMCNMCYSRYFGADICDGVDVRRVGLF